jgi:hypothetical protein
MFQQDDVSPIKFRVTRKKARPPLLALDFSKLPMKSKFPLFFLISFTIITSHSDAAEFVGSASYQLTPGVTLTVRASRFIPSKHSIRKVRGHVIIDGRQVMGVDGNIPTVQLDEAYLTIRGRKIALDTSCLYDPWHTAPSKEHFEAKWWEGEPQNDREVLTISGTFSDGAGGYIVHWLVVDDTSLRISIETS